ncbi:MAG: DUF4124 domain-containing protein [Gammaproteobacteria bacterium]|jgi:hypothetical protein
MKRNLIVILTILLLIWLLPATARTYKWVDENGKTVYSQSRPPSGKATIIKPPPPQNTPSEEIMKKLEAQRNAISESRKKKDAAQSKEMTQARKAEIKMKNCENAKKSLADIEPHSRIRMKMPDGSYKQLTYEERQKQIDMAKKNIEKYCN